MGYRSEVAISFDESADKLFKQNAEMIPELKQLINDAQLADSGKYHWDWVKWYDSYTEIDAVMTFLDFLETLDYESYGFIRIGEETEDMETRGCTGSHDMYINRCIDW